MAGISSLMAIVNYSGADYHYLYNLQGEAAGLVGSTDMLVVKYNKQHLGVIEHLFPGWRWDKLSKKMILVITIALLTVSIASGMLYQERECPIELVYSYENLFDDSWKSVSQTGKSWIAIRKDGFWTAEMCEKAYLAETGRVLSEDYLLDTERYTYIWCHGCRHHRRT